MNAALCLSVTGGQRAALLRCLLQGQTMNSILEILVINTKEGKSKKPPYADYKISEAHCVLRDENGAAGAVGVLTIPRELEASARVGVFTAGFTLDARTYGEDAGKIVASLKSLTPVPPGAFRNAAAAKG
jgi:hypothetical protein